MSNISIILGQEIQQISGLSSLRPRSPQPNSPIINLRLPTILDSKRATATLNRNMRPERQVYTVALHTTAASSIQRLMEVLTKCLQHNWPIDPLIRLVNMLRLRLSSYYIVPLHHRLIQSINKTSFARLRRKHALIGFALDGQIQQIELGSADNLLMRASTASQRLNKAEALTISGLGYSGLATEPAEATVGLLGSRFVEITALPSRQALERDVCAVANDLRRHAQLLYDEQRGLYDYRVTL